MNLIIPLIFLFMMIGVCTSCSIGQNDILDLEPNCNDQYLPPRVVPETQCANPCAYGYRGSFDFIQNELVINCSPSNKLWVYVDSINLLDQAFKPIRAFTLEAWQPQDMILGLFCSHDFQWLNGSSEDSSLQIIYREDPKQGISRIHLIPQPEFWDTFPFERFSFQLSTKRPLSELQPIPH